VFRQPALRSARRLRLRARRAANAIGPYLPDMLQPLFAAEKAS
jgi:hypothetical protein